jgi:hypothetical protein
VKAASQDKSGGMIMGDFDGDLFCPRAKKYIYMKKNIQKKAKKRQNVKTLKHASIFRLFIAYFAFVYRLFFVYFSFIYRLFFVYLSLKQKLFNQWSIYCL